MPIAPRSRPPRRHHHGSGSFVRSRKYTVDTEPEQRLWSKAMESPIELVCRFCAAWADNVGAGDLAAFFTDDAVYHNIPLAPVTGREAIANNFKTFIRPGPPGIEALEFHIINIAADGPVVMTERVDVFKLPHKSFELPVMGTFEVSDGKISAWRDYFDMNQFTSRMG